MFTFKQLILLAPFLPSLLTSTIYDQAYIFGDSLSDFNNVYKLSNHVKPPKEHYFEGRYSNGPTWVEYLTKKLNIKDIKSFAYAGATSDNVQFPATLVQGGVPGALQQIEAFEKYYEQNKNKLPKNPLVTFAFGGNDFHSPGSSPQKMVENLERGLNTLVTKFNLTSFVIMNSTPLDLSPYAKSHPKPYQDQFTQIVYSIEYLWKQVIEKYNKDFPNVTFYQFNSRDYIKSIIEGTVKEDEFKNMEFNKPCFNKPLDSNDEISQSSTTCKDADRYIFWDKLHPTTKIHKYVADLVYDVVIKN